MRSTWQSVVHFHRAAATTKGLCRLHPFTLLLLCLPYPTHLPSLASKSPALRCAEALPASSAATCAQSASAASGRRSRSSATARL